MLRSVRLLYGFTIRGGDGTMGKVHDILFSDSTWEITHMVLKTGTWLSGQDVLLPAAAIGPPDWAHQNVSVGMSKKEVAARTAAGAAQGPRAGSKSTRAWIGYAVVDHPGKQVGFLEGFLFDEMEWRIRYLVVDTQGWMARRRVLVAPQSIKSITAPVRRIDLTLGRELIAQRPQHPPELFERTS